MSKKSSLFIFTIGAAAGWAAAQKLNEQAQPWTPSVEHQPSIPKAPETTFESKPAYHASKGGDPFRGAFQGAMEEISLHSQDDEEDTEVA